MNNRTHVNYVCVRKKEIKKERTKEKNTLRGHGDFDREQMGFSVSFTYLAELELASFHTVKKERKKERQKMKEGTL